MWQKFFCNYEIFQKRKLHLKNTSPSISAICYSIEREEKVLNRLLKSAKIEYSKDSIIRIWREIFQASTKLQEKNSSIIDTKRSINSINVYKGGKSSLVGKENIIKLS